MGAKRCHTLGLDWGHELSGVGRADRSRLAAEALGRLAAAGTGERRPLVADITDLVDERTATIGELHDQSVCGTGSGLPVPPSSIRRAMCEGRITPVIVDASGVVLNAGRTIRRANRHQRRALRAMYRTCALGDCDVPFDRCEIHHLLPCELGGATDLRNLVPVCSRHHHVVRTLLVSDPDVATRQRAPDRPRRPSPRPSAA